MTIAEAAALAEISYKSATQILRRLERQGIYRAQRTAKVVVDEEFVAILKSRKGKRGHPGKGAHDSGKTSPPPTTE